MATSRTLSVLGLVMTLVTSGADAQEPPPFDRTKQPEPGPPPAIQLPQIQRATLANGLNIMLVEYGKLPVVQMQMVIGAGAERDPIGKAGLASMTADMLDEGTTTRTALQIADEIDFIGARLSTTAGFDGAYGSLLTLKEHLDTAMEVFADVLVRPSFPEHEFDRLKRELLTRLLQQKDRAGIVAGDVFAQRLYGPQHPYGYPVAGSDSTVAAMTLDDVKDFYQKTYAPNNATLIVVGDVTLDGVRALAQKHFGKWGRKRVPALTLPPASNPERTTIYIVDKPGAPQSEIRIGNIALGRHSKDFHAVMVLQQIFGGLSGRLFLNLRETKGYTYGAHAQFAMRRAAGPLIAGAAVRTDVTDSALIEFMHEFQRIRDELVPDEEFQRHRNAVILRIPRSFETPAQIASQLANIVLYGLPDDHLNRLVEEYKAVIPEEVRRVAREYLKPENLVVTIVGDKAAILGPLQALAWGKIVECDLSGNIISASFR